MYKILSYPMTENMPGWPGTPPMRLEKKQDIDRGDAANTFMVSFYNHAGTHYDAPLHFVPGAVSISQLGLDRFIFEKPLLLDIPKGATEKVTAADLKPYAARIERCDLLMIRTGFSKYRRSDPDIYEKRGPGISAECAEYLTANFKNLSALAVDFVSLASFSDREDGNRAHQTLLGMHGEHFICGIEDVNMEPLNPDRLKKVFALPIFVQGVDSAPVTVLAEEE